MSKIKHGISLLLVFTIVAFLFSCGGGEDKEASKAPVDVIENILKNQGDLALLQQPETRANINKLNADGVRPLHYLVNSRWSPDYALPCLKALLEAGADPNLPSYPANHTRKQPVYIIQLLISHGNHEMLQVLLDGGYFHKGMLQIGLSSTWVTAGGSTDVEKCRRLLMEYGALHFLDTGNPNNAKFQQELQNIQVKSDVKFAREPKAVAPPADFEAAKAMNETLIDLNYSNSTSDLSEIFKYTDTEALAYLCRRGFSLKAITNQDYSVWNMSRKGAKECPESLANSIAFLKLLLEQGYPFAENNHRYLVIAIANCCSKDNFNELYPLLEQIAPECGKDSRLYKKFKEAPPEDLTPEQLEQLYKLLDNTRPPMQGQRQRSGMGGAPGQRPGMGGAPGQRQRPERHQGRGRPAPGQRQRPAGVDTSAPSSTVDSGSAAPAASLNQVLNSGKSAEEIIDDLKQLKNLSAAVNVNAPDGRHPLIIAINKPEVVKFLLDNGAKADDAVLNRLMSRPHNPAGTVFIIRSLPQEKKDAMLVECVMHFTPRQTPGIRNLIIGGASPQALMPSGETVMQFAEKRGDHNLIKCLKVRPR